MNGFLLATGFLALATGADPRSDDFRQTGPPGTGRTVLVIPDRLVLNIRQVPGPNGPVVRIHTAGWPVRAPVVRFEHRGRLHDVFTTPNDFSVSTYPLDWPDAPRPKPVR